jgi:VanZ family protein
MFRTLTAAAAWTSLAFIAYATLSPLNERPEISGLFSHFDRYFGYAVCGGLFGLAYPRRTLLVCLIVFGSAIVLELAQLLTPDRHARVLDALRKLIGGVLGIGFARLMISSWFRNRLNGRGREP